MSGNETWSPIPRRESNPRERASLLDAAVGRTLEGFDLDPEVEEALARLRSALHHLLPTLHDLPSLADRLGYLVRVAAGGLEIQNRITAVLVEKPPTRESWAGCSDRQSNEGFQHPGAQPDGPALGTHRHDRRSRGASATGVMRSQLTIDG